MKITKLITLSLLYMFLSSVIIFSQIVKINLDAGKKISKINPLLFGMNVARWDESIFPAPSRDMLLTCDRDAIKKLKDANVTLLKYPGGNDADSYIWNDPKNNDSEMDTDEYGALLKTMNAEGFITINFNHPPELAAEWVKYCNIKNSFKVKYWEVGDEQWGSWAKGHTSPEEYAKKYVSFVKAMKAVDPSILVAMNVKMENDPDGWTVRSLKAAKGYIDMVTITYYPVTNKQEKEEQYILSTPKDFVKPYLEVRKALHAVFPPAIADTMWIIPVGYNTVNSRPGPVTLSMVNALWVADFIGIMANLGVEHADYWALHNVYPPGRGDYGILSSDGANIPSYSYYAFKLMSDHLMNSMVSAVSNDTMVTVYSSINNSESNLSVILINKEKYKDKEVEIICDNFESKDKPRIMVLNQTNKYQSSKNIIFNSSNKKIKIPPYSIVVIDFENKNSKSGMDNLAKGSIVTASTYSQTGPYFKPSSVVDGKPYTRWASGAWLSKDGTDEQWLQLDLKKQMDINNIKIYWDYRRAKEYDISISADKKKWEKIITNENGNGELDDYNFSDKNTRYIRINMKKGTKSISTYNISEIEIYKK